MFISASGQLTVDPRIFFAPRLYTSEPTVCARPSESLRLSEAISDVLPERKSDTDARGAVAPVHPEPSDVPPVRKRTRDDEAAVGQTAERPSSCVEPTQPEKRAPKRQRRSGTKRSEVRNAASHALSSSDTQEVTLFPNESTYPSPFLLSPATPLLARSFFRLVATFALHVPGSWIFCHPL